MVDLGTNEALAAADAAIAEHGWPWNPNPNGAISEATEKARAMLALTWTQGYRAGAGAVWEMVDPVLDELERHLKALGAS